MKQLQREDGHFVQEHSPDQIGTAVEQFVRKMRALAPTARDFASGHHPAGRTRIHRVKGSKTMTVNDHVVRYQEHVSTKSYEELIAAFEEAVADAGPGEPSRTLERVRNGENTRGAWEAAFAPLLGPSGFTRAFSLDTGQLSSWYGRPAKAKTYIYGNAIIAASMLVHDIRVASRVPLQILIYEAENGEVRLGYDLPSSIMSRFGNKELDAVALELDKKLVSFATELTGART